jgi:calcium/calmodulin-dependent protein kinase (CaM kinase) II
MQDRDVQELIELSQRLLASIASADWDAYASLCDPSLTAVEPEALGQLVEGMEFHHFYFKLGAGSAVRNTTLCSPKVRVMGDVAVVSYIRLDQHLRSDNLPATSGASETRVWQRQLGQWKHVHFHRSPLPLPG